MILRFAHFDSLGRDTGFVAKIHFYSLVDFVFQQPFEFFYDNGELRRKLTRNAVDTRVKEGYEFMRKEDIGNATDEHGGGCNGGGGRKKCLGIGHI